MDTFIHHPDPEEEPESSLDRPSSSEKPSSSDMPTGQYSPVDQTPDLPLETPGEYPMPEEPVPGEITSELFTVDEKLPGSEQAHPFRAYTPPMETPSVPAGASVFPPQPPTPAYAPPPSQPAYTPSYTYTTRSAKDRTLALVAEVLPGLFGLLGIGWIYAGSTTTGIAILIGFLLWNFFAIILDVITAGIFACVHLPVNMIAVVGSAILLYNYTKKHPELFGA